MTAAALWLIGLGLFSGLGLFRSFGLLGCLGWFWLLCFLVGCGVFVHGRMGVRGFGVILNLYLRRIIGLLDVGLVGLGLGRLNRSDMLGSGPSPIILRRFWLALPLWRVRLPAPWHADPLQPWRWSASAFAWSSTSDLA